MNKNSAKNVDEYIALHDGETRKRLEQLRELFRKTLPKATEDISYLMPAYREKPGKRPFAFFGATKNSVAIYALHFDVRPALLEQAKPYLTSKSTMKFPNDKPIPMDLLQQILEEKGTQLGLV